MYTMPDHRALPASPNLDDSHLTSPALPRPATYCLALVAVPSSACPAGHRLPRPVRHAIQCQPRLPSRSMSRRDKPFCDAGPALPSVTCSDKTCLACHAFLDMPGDTQNHLACRALEYLYRPTRAATSLPYRAL